jgi:hypothetical protein
VRYSRTAERLTQRSQPRGLALAWVLLFGLALATPAVAAEPARVLLVAPPDASRLISEALVRAQGELFAVGLASARTAAVPTEGPDNPAEGTDEAPRLPTDVYGLLVLEQREGSIIIHAWAPHATASLDARVDLGAPGMTAEVLAVKAVETLRAAMLQFARRERGAVPEAVRGFTKLPTDEAALDTPPPKPPKEQPKPRKEEPEPPEPPPDEQPAPAVGPFGGSAPLGAWLGPQVAVEPGAGASVGGQLGLLVGPRWGFAAIAFDTSFGRLELDAAEGDAKVHRRALTFQLGGRVQATRGWELFARAGVGYAAFDVRGRGEQGYRGLHLTHESFTLQANAGVTWWLTRGFGAYASLGGALALDAPSVRIAGQRAATLDQPSLFMSLGATAATF